jgi:hypothetical protein
MMQMRALIYKRTHSGDPDPETGVFGNNDCMKTIRGRSFDAVIGVGGIGREARSEGIARKLTWIGIGPRKTGEPSRPLVTFDHFLYYGEDGPLLDKKAPALATRLYDGNVRHLMDSLSSDERLDVGKILDLARDAPPSNQLKVMTEWDFQDTKCPSNSCRRADFPISKRDNTHSGKCRVWPPPPFLGASHMG